MHQGHSLSARALDRTGYRTQLAPSRPVEGSFGTVKSVRILDREERDLHVYIPSEPEARWALEHLIQRYSNDPKPTGPSSEAFEARWLSEHCQEGSIERVDDKLQLKFGVHRLKTSDPLDIAGGLQIHADSYNGTYHGKKIGPHFHNTCVAPRVKLPEGAGPDEWLTQHLKVAFGLAVGAKCPDGLHPYYLYYAYGPMAGKAMNRVPDDHDKLRTYTVTNAQDRLLNALAKGPDCAEAVFFVLECSQNLDLNFLSYPEVETHLRHWPHYFKNGLLPQRQVALFKWLAGKSRANPLQDTFRFCEALYGQKKRSWTFKENVDITAIVGDDDIDEALSIAEKEGMSFERDYKFIKKTFPIVSEGTSLKPDQVRWLCGRIACEARAHPNRGEKRIHAVVEVFKGLSGEDLDKDWRFFLDYLSKHERIDEVLTMLEAEPETAFRLPGIKDRPQEPGTGLALRDTQNLMVRGDAGWGHQHLELAAGPGASATPGVALFRLYRNLDWAGRDIDGRSWPIETQYFDHLAPHLGDPLNPTKAALDMLKKMRDNVNLPDLERMDLCACMVSPRWLTQAFGHKGWNYEAESERRKEYKDRAYTVMGKVMDFARFGVFSELEAVGIMETLIDEPIGHYAPELASFERRLAHSKFRAEGQCDYLPDRDVDRHIGLRLNDGLVAAKLYWMEQLLPAFNDLMILSQMGVVSAEQTKTLIQTQVAEAKANFTYKEPGKRLFPEDVFTKTTNLRPDDFTWASQQNIDWSVVLAKHWKNLRGYIQDAKTWQSGVEDSARRLDRAQLEKVYKKAPEGLNPRSIEDYFQQAVFKKWGADFAHAIGYANFKKAAELNGTRPSELELTEIETEILQFLVWVEQNYAWIEKTDLRARFQAILRETVRRMQAGEKITYGTAHSQLETTFECYRTINTALDSIEDTHNRDLARKLVISERMDAGTASAQASQLARISRELDPAEMEAILLQAGTRQDTNESALVRIDSSLSPATREVSKARFRRAMPASGDTTLDQANTAVWAASGSALELSGEILEDTSSVVLFIEGLREQIRSARRESFGLPPLGSKIHFLKDLSRERIEALMRVSGLSNSGFNLDGHRALLLPAVPSGKELEIMVRALSTVGDLPATDPQLHLCIGTRLPKRDTAVLGSAVMLASTDMREYARTSFMTSHEGFTAGRMMLYDDGGSLSSLPFVRKQALETRGRTDTLARFARRDPVNYQLVGGVLADGILGDQPFSQLAGPWKKRYREIIGDHGLSHIINETWIFHRGKEKDTQKSRARHFANVTAVNQAYTACARDFHETGRAEGIIFDVRDHIADLADQIRPIQEEMLASSTYCKERQQLLEF